MGLEDFPQPENQESIESLKQRVVEALRQKGLEDPESIQLFTEWAKKQEAQVESAGSVEQSREIQIRFEIERADIYNDAGFKSEAAVALEDARTIASNEGLDSLQKEIEQKLNSL